MYTACTAERSVNVRQNTTMHENMGKTKRKILNADCCVVNSFAFLMPGLHGLNN